MVGVSALALASATVIAALPMTSFAKGVAPGHLISVFPMRNMVMVSGSAYAPGTSVTVTDAKNGVTVASATGLIGFDQTLNVNHPGGACWTPAMPDVQPGDVISATGAGSTTVATISANAASLVGTTVTVTGLAKSTVGAPIDPVNFGTNLQVRLIAKKNQFATDGRRDLRSDKNGTLTWNATTGVFVATIPIVSADVALFTNGAVQTRAIWADNLGSPTQTTIYEVGEKKLALC